MAGHQEVVMKSLTLVAAVIAFELAFLTSIAEPPAPAPQAIAARATSGTVAQQGGAPVPCTPPG
jgi:hypothetical protein